MAKKYDNYKEYKKALISKEIKATEIMKDITIPSVVYKYRSFGDFEGEVWNENPYWRESMEGEVFFSTPKDFNSNDPDDCRLQIDIDEFVKIKYNCNIKDCATIKSTIIKQIMQSWIDSIQSGMRVGCFTTVDCLKHDMWDNKYFGYEGKGYCIEYEVLEEIFYPQDMVFLKVYYDDKGFDATEMICNLDKIEKDVRITAQSICQGYTPFLMKPKKYIEEKEWRLIIPSSRFDSYFEKHDCYKRNMSKAIKAIYLGPKYKEIPDWESKRDTAVLIAKRIDASVYEVCIDANGAYEYVPVGV